MNNIFKGFQSIIDAWKAKGEPKKKSRITGIRGEGERERGNSKLLSEDCRFEASRLDLETVSPRIENNEKDAVKIELMCSAVPNV